MTVKINRKFPLLSSIKQKNIISKGDRPLFAWLLAIGLSILTLLTACNIAPVMPQERIFLNLSLDFLGEYKLPKMNFKDTPVGGLSGITYNRKSDRFYAISDDRSNLAPARFYTLKLDLNPTGIKNIKVENVTFLKDQSGNTYAKNSIDAEGIAFSPPASVFISSEGDVKAGISPFINEFNLKTGKSTQSLPIPKRYIPDAKGEKQQRGIQNNLAFESLTLSPTGSLSTKSEPLRLFTATESALIQDKDAFNPDKGQKSRFLHYLLSDGPPILISEHLYQLEASPKDAIYNGLSELLAIDQSGHFLSLERSFGLSGFNERIYQISTGGATDTSQIVSLKGDVNTVAPIQKKLLLDLSKLNIILDNLEGMTFGPRFADGSRSLILVSDDNFRKDQVTQFLLFRLK